MQLGHVPRTVWKGPNRVLRQRGPERRRWRITGARNTTYRLTEGWASAGRTGDGMREQGCGCRTRDRHTTRQGLASGAHASAPLLVRFSLHRCAWLPCPQLGPPRPLHSHLYAMRGRLSCLFLYSSTLAPPEAETLLQTLRGEGMSALWGKRDDGHSSWARSGMMAQIRLKYQ